MTRPPARDAVREFLSPLGRLRLWPAVASVAAAVAVWAAALIGGVDFAIWQLVLFALAAVLAYSVVSGMRADTEPAPELVVHTVNEPSWRPFTDVNRWEDRFIFAEAKPGRFATTNARQQLTELAAERLRLRRGLSLAEQPEECRVVLGEATYLFLTGPVPDCPAPRVLGEHLQAIEEIQ
ncbi:hypothetical protein SAMN05216298_2270 [Glycomyces sambucus]|uniref:Uncharacterized protein n=1 Tax=Glycomyces sambucus TaxID=380244 RepID=A0A1G9GM26_9ACTN|nr:hypothetical protein [Glycomyces sambucus]SDL01323.1 hypothetical protein SAMN05216298_2270 [Glycomyces sambucus]